MNQDRTRRILDAIRIIQASGLWWRMREFFARKRAKRKARRKAR